MAKNLVIMRHGKAVTASAEQDDFDRNLSEAGKRALSATLPQSLGLLDLKGKDFKVVSSPAARAMQTAEQLEKALRKVGYKTADGIEECSELWYQNIEGFVDYLACCDCDTVFAVGHNPFVVNLVEHLTGAQLPCATGALVCIALNSPASCRMSAQGSYENRLLWFAQGPASQRWKTVVNLESTLRDCAEEMLEKRDAFFENPEDIETMHKLRVSIRTLRSLVAFVKPWQDTRQNANLQSVLKSIVGQTSQLRELDVFAQQVHETEGASSELIEFCDNEALVERERVMKALSSKQYAKAFKKAAEMASNVKWKQRLTNEGLPTKAVRSRFDSMAEELEHDMEGLSLSDVDRTHDIRKSAKRVRYAAEKFKQTLGPDAVDIAKGMTAHQDNLGTVCDARVNIDLINDFLARDLPERVAWDLTLLRAKNETFLYSALKASEDQ